MPKMKTKFWNIMKNEEENSADMILYGTIGSDEWWDDICDKTFKEDIANLGEVENINLHINSPGGSVFAAVAIANTLKNHKAKVTAYIDGLAASAATIITSACDVVKMPKNALFMIHNPLTWAYGNKQELEKTGILLDKVKDSILETYLAKAKDKTKEELSTLMDEEKWFNAEEAKEYGFIDEIVGEMEKPQNVNNLLIVNSLAFDISKFKNFPNSRPAVSPKNIKDEMTVEKFINSYPEIYQEILNQGIISERKRIQEIEDLDVAGYDEIINTAKFNEPIDAANLALKILNLKKLKNKNTLENIITESQAIAIPVAPLKDESSGAVAGISVTNILKYMNKKTGGK
ncbi:head maturation protease, ClpP-related [Fusobacterium animalis]|uniref:head maturation protease, ClpP-related n=1 Tax=Fusobacterium TaxID=848 RepID=UPI0003B8E6CB|nr:head maturation protease, ClpP-related [Fusobacterium nucleatum]ERT39739.1 ATP-dependent Clp endopeptidase, proteolytic subunit ClpP [Fusobacterium nucleatum CTI-5]DAN57577.1 MAG TPA: putative ATP dependent Clp protease [Caudoviricetes sp.]